MGLFDWLKKGAPLPSVSEFIESKPALSKIFGYEPKSPVEFATAGLGVAAVTTMGLVAGAKAIGTGIIKAVPKILKTIIPKTIKGKLLAGTGAIIGAGILTKSKKAREFTVEAARDIQEKPAVIFGLGERIGEIIEGEDKPLTLKEGLVAGGLIGGLAVAGAIVVPKVKGYLEERKEKPIESIEAIPTITDDKDQLIAEKPMGIEGETAITPETTTITTGKKPYKRRRAIKTPSVRQSVKINIISKPIGLKITNKRYLNELIVSK